MSLSTTFGSWRDRLTYLLAEAQILVAGLLVSAGAVIIYLRPSVPGVPGIVWGWIATGFLFGPILTAVFIWGVRKLRNRRMITVYHINGVTDTREKYYVEPGVWKDKTVEGPAPYWCEESEVWEVREFEHFEDTGDLVVTGCYMSQLADSKLITVKAMLFDVHNQLIETAVAYNKLRARISKMGVEIERDTINFHAEADERGLMGQRTAVKERFEAAESDAREWDSDEIKDLGDYEHDYDPVANPEGVAIEPTATDPGVAATDGGTEP